MKAVCCTLITTNSVELAQALLGRKPYVCGTLRKDLKCNPKKVISKKLKKGDVYAQENKRGVKVISWVEKRRVNMIYVLELKMMTSYC